MARKPKLFHQNQPETGFQAFHCTRTYLASVRLSVSPNASKALHSSRTLRSPRAKADKAGNRPQKSAAQELEINRGKVGNQPLKRDRPRYNQESGADRQISRELESAADRLTRTPTDAHTNLAFSMLDTHSSFFVKDFSTVLC